MNLRDWATPLTMGSCVLMAATGLLMFFHLDSGLNKEAHEWLSWALLAGVALHATANFPALKRHFQRRNTWAVVAAFVVLLGLSFIQSPEAEGKAARGKAAEALLAAPITLVAQVAGKDSATVVADLGKAGVNLTADQSLKQALADDRERQLNALAVIFNR
jgi:hypothetical protein